MTIKGRLKKLDNWKQLRLWCVQAAKTGMKLERVQGPKKYGNAWPAYTLDYPHAKPIRLRPSPADISSMMDFLKLVNTHLDEDDRKLLTQYGSLCARRKISEYLKKNSINNGKYYRLLDSVFKKLFELAIINRTLVNSEAVASEQECGNKQARSEIVRTPAWWRSDKQTSPAHLGTFAEQRSRLVAKLNKQNEKRNSLTVP